MSLHRRSVSFEAQNISAPARTVGAGGDAKKGECFLCSPDSHSRKVSLGREGDVAPVAVDSHTSC